MIFSRFECRSRGNSQDPRSSASMRTLGNLDCGYATRCPYAPPSPPPSLPRSSIRCCIVRCNRGVRARARARGRASSPFKIPVSGESMRSDATLAGWNLRCAKSRDRISAFQRGGGGDPWNWFASRLLTVYRADFSTRVRFTLRSSRLIRRNWIEERTGSANRGLPLLLVKRL